MADDRQESAPPEELAEALDLLLLKDQALDVAAEGITIADMRQPNQPLIFINEGFERLTGFSAELMKGQNCQFLQGEETDPETVDEIRNQTPRR